MEESNTMTDANYVPDRPRHWRVEDELASAIRDIRRSQQASDKAGATPINIDASGVYDRDILVKRSRPTKPRAAGNSRSKSFEELAFGWLNLGCIAVTGFGLLFLIMWAIDTLAKL